MIHNIPQPTLEQYLTEHVLNHPNIELRKGFSFNTLEQVCAGHNSIRSRLKSIKVNDGVVTTIQEHTTGEYFHIRSRHVIACDGMRSKVREHLQISSEGEDSGLDFSI